MTTQLRTHITIKDICEGFVYNEYEDRGLYELFKTINIAGIPLNDQELLNAIYS